MNYKTKFNPNPNRLSQDKRFKAFTKPVDLEEVPDYAEVIKKPMDLSTVLSNIDLHRYGAVKDFLQDVDLIWQNALEYNPDRDPSDRQIRHRACALKDNIQILKILRRFVRKSKNHAAQEVTRLPPGLLPPFTTSFPNSPNLRLEPQLLLPPIQLPLLSQLLKTQPRGRKEERVAGPLAYM